MSRERTSGLGGRRRPSRYALLVAAAIAAFVVACRRAPQVPGSLRAAAAEQAKGRYSSVYHRVRRGENLARIARAYRVSAQWVAEANQLDPERPLRPGRTLWIPGARRPMRLPRPGRRGGDIARLIESVAGRATPDRVPRLRWPVRGELKRKFSHRRGRAHDGLDLAAPEGTPVRAAAGGTVVYSDVLGHYGRVVLVRHRGGLVTVYAHNQRNLVDVGARVRPGQAIARVGRSGNAPRPLLHFEVRERGRPTDPFRFLR